MLYAHSGVLTAPLSGFMTLGGCDLGDTWARKSQFENLVMLPRGGARIRGVAGDHAGPPEEVGAGNTCFNLRTAMTDPAQKGC